MSKWVKNLKAVDFPSDATVHISAFPKSGGDVLKQGPSKGFCSSHRLNPKVKQFC